MTMSPDSVFLVFSWIFCTAPVRSEGVKIRLMYTRISMETVSRRTRTSPLLSDFRAMKAATFNVFIVLSAP